MSRRVYRVASLAEERIEEERTYRHGFGELGWLPPSLTLIVILTTTTTNNNNNDNNKGYLLLR